jgi:tetratricopeptide (TPR) repeat protein
MKFVKLILPCLREFSFSISGEMNVLNDTGVFFKEIYQTEKALESLERALKLAKALNDKNLHIGLPLTLQNIGDALLCAGKSDESLSYFVDAKERMNNLLGPHPHPLTLRILEGLGKRSLILRDLPEALRCFKEAFDMNRVIYGENSIGCNMEFVCGKIASILQEMKSYGEAKEYYTKAITIAKKFPLTKNNCSFLVMYLYDLASICLTLKEQNEASTHLEEARKIVKDTDCNDWALLHLLVEIIIKYAKMGSIANCMKVMSYVKHREIEKSLFTQPSRSLLTLKMLNGMKIRVKIYPSTLKKAS